MEQMKAADTRKTEKLREEDLEAVSGGGGHPWDPESSSECWFTSNGGSEMRDGAYRKKCRAFACVALTTVRGQGTGWFMCRCHGSDRCVDGWHYENCDWAIAYGQ